MVQPILLNRTDTDDTDPPLLNFGELAVATGPTYTKMWLGDGGENRVLLSDDPADAPIFGGDGASGNYLPLTGGALTGSLSVNAGLSGANPAPLIVGGRGITYSAYNATDSIAWTFSAGSIYSFINGTAYGPMITLNVGNTTYLQLTGGTMAGQLTLAANPVNPLQAATKQYVDAEIGSARYIPQLDPTNDVAVTAAGAAPILSGYETPVSAGDDWFMIRTMRDVDGTAIIMRGPTFPDPNAADGTEFWVGAGGNFLFWMQPNGQFILPVDPVDPMAAVTKEYVDAIPGATISDTPPANPSPGDFWYDSVDGDLYIWYVDATSGQWVPVSSSGGGGGGTSVALGDNPPASPALGDLWFDTVGSQLYIFDTDQDQWIITANTPGGGAGGGAAVSVQVSFYFPGEPAASAAIIVPIAFPITVPANLAGSVTYLGALPTANTGNFILYHSSTTGTQGIGTISFDTNGDPIFGGTGGSVPAGDTLLITAPTTPDATLGDIGISILVTRT